MPGCFQGSTKSFTTVLSSITISSVFTNFKFQLLCYNLLSFSLFLFSRPPYFATLQCITPSLPMHLSFFTFPASLLFLSPQLLLTLLLPFLLMPPLPLFISFLPHPNSISYFLLITLYSLKPPFSLSPSPS